MARPLPVNLLLAGTGAVLLVSGIGKEPIGEVLRGSFGNLKPGQATAAGTTETSEAPGENSTGEGGQVAPSPTVYSDATFAASPTTFTNKQPTPKQQAEGIARILLEGGIHNPTIEQLEAARYRYQQQTGVSEYERLVYH